MPITLDRSVCCDLEETISREWLVTNGAGGYAAGTVAGALTRMQHGLLVALQPGAQTPQLLLAKLDEEVVFDQRTYYLGTNEYQDGTLNPAGFVHLETFRLEEGFPIFTYHLGGMNGIMLEKRIWMPKGRNTTCIQYRAFRTATYEHTHDGNNNTRPQGDVRRYQDYADAMQGSLTLTILPLSAYRIHTYEHESITNTPFHVQHLRSSDGSHTDHDWPVLPKGTAGCTVQAGEDGLPYHILASGGRENMVTFLPAGVRYWNFLHRHDTLSGYTATTDLYLPGVFRVTLRPGEETTLTVVVTTEELSTIQLHPQQLALSYQRAVEEQRQLLHTMVQPQRFFGETGEAAQAQRIGVLPFMSGSDPQSEGEAYINTLLHAGDHFLFTHKPSLSRSSSEYGIPHRSSKTHTLISEFYSMTQQTRDALMALPGLTVVPGRFDDARGLLRTIGDHLKYGLLPAQLSLAGTTMDQCEPVAADTTLWYFYALDHYLRVSHDDELLHELYPLLVAGIEHYIQGKTPGISLDPHDGLLIAQLPGSALTWMNATIDNQPVTPRGGKPVEVNALWFHALSLMHEWSLQLNRRGVLYHSASIYQELLTLCRSSFQQRYWYEDGGYLYDVVDGPEGNDSAIRPNQLLAISLRYSVLDESYHARVLEIVTQHLLTPLGIRTLSRQDSRYQGHLRQNRDAGAATLHQGSAWTWLIGPYIDALLRVNMPAREHSSAQLSTEYLWRRGVHLLEGFETFFHEGLLGMSGSVFDGDEPQRPDSRPGSALATAELLRTYHNLVIVRATHPDYILC